MNRGEGAKPNMSFCYGCLVIMAHEKYYIFSNQYIHVYSDKVL